jgi:hypothetical protein
MGVLGTALLVGLLLYFLSRSKTRKATVDVSEARGTWRFNVRHMVCTFSGSNGWTGAYEIRRNDDGVWEMRASDSLRADPSEHVFMPTLGFRPPKEVDADQERQPWQPFGEPALSLVEAAWLRYQNGE